MQVLVVLYKTNVCPHPKANAGLKPSWNRHTKSNHLDCSRFNVNTNETMGF